MNRLTKVVSIHNNEPEFYEANIDLYPKMMGYEHQQAEMDCINKLGQLEDIEQELGIDLITLFKGLKNGFYFKYKDKILSSNDYFLQITVDLRDDWTFDIISGHLSLLSIKFKDYSKTWALTREELE